MSECDAAGCASAADTTRTGVNREGRRTTISLCVLHRIDFDEGDAIHTHTGMWVRPE
jgi:hypothetical protein